MVFDGALSALHSGRLLEGGCGWLPDAFHEHWENVSVILTRSILAPP